MKRLLSLALLAATSALPLQAIAQEAAGKVIMLTGRATAVGNTGTIRRLAKDDMVYAGELINSGTGSYVNLRFADGAFFLLRPDTRFQIEDYHYTPPAPAAPAAPVAVAPAAKPAATAPAVAPLVTANQGESQPTRAFFRLVKGGFRSVSGLIGKLNRDDYRVSTPVATIGIRGTAYSARLCDADCSDRDEINLKVKQAGGNAAPTDQPVLVTTVDEGEIQIGTGDSAVAQPSCSKASTSDSLLPRAQEDCGGAFISGPGGTTTIVRDRPSTEQSERSLDPRLCL